MIGRPGSGLVTLLEETTFCISDASGDIVPGGAQGLFFRDTRFISRLELRLDGELPEPVAVQPNDPFRCTFLARRPPGPFKADSTLLLIRRRYVGNGMRDEITLRNLGHEPAAAHLTVAVNVDFADLFEVKEGRAHYHDDDVDVSAADGVLRLRCRRGSNIGVVAITGTADPSVAPDLLTWQTVIEPGASWVASMQVTPSMDGTDVIPHYGDDEPLESTTPAKRLADWRRRSPLLITSDERLTNTFATSTEDVGSLRIFGRGESEKDEHAVIAAGAPWFMTLFGRDSLLTAWMLLPLDLSLALGTLRTLASLQGEKVNPLTEEEPGKILHETRSGRDASLALGGGSVYYGTADATPLFVMLLGELARWGLPAEDADELLPHADRALDWIVNYGDRDGDGFVEYQRATEQGLVNQGWKDSFDGITFASGQIAEAPIALAEVQGYVYAAYLARAHFARERGDTHTARHWADRARKLRRDFNRAFWLPDRGYFALGLDGDKRPIDALGSNQGHCLWTGIVDRDKAASVAQHLTSRPMFSGFGIRTLATGMGAYNPMSYHNGSVWPHDNAIIAAGLMRYGFVPQAQQVAGSILEAADKFGGRLPELFCGFDRSDFAAPVAYPTSCSPQAWAAAAPFLLLRTLLRFDPAVPSGKVWCDPEIPARLLPLQVEALHIADGTVSVEIAQGGWHLNGLPAGLKLVRHPRSPLTALHTATDERRTPAAKSATATASKRRRPAAGKTGPSDAGAPGQPGPGEPGQPEAGEPGPASAASDATPAADDEQPRPSAAAH
jgi:glycogen debranching enzyme